MRTPRVLVLYGTSYGQTAKIAERIGGVLQRRGCAVSLANAGDSRVRPEDFDAVVVGASVIARGHQPAVTRWVRDHVGALNAMPTAFFSVSASAGSANENGRAAARRLRDEYLQTAGWRPDLQASMAGAINYTRYNPLLRWYMKRASRMNGGSTDTSRDHEYTDWTQVERFAEACAGLVDRGVPVEFGAPGQARAAAGPRATAAW